MMQEPYLSAYDLQFRLFGFPIRIAWGFWALALVLGFEGARRMDREYAWNDGITPVRCRC